MTTLTPTYLFTQSKQLIRQQPRAVLLMLALWLLSMISLPIFKWTIGDNAIVFGVYVTTLLQAATVVSILAHAWGWGLALRTAFVVVAVTWAAEALGTATGFPFGHYTYTDVLQPQIANVPVIIATAWLMMLPSSWAVSDILTNGNRGIRFILVAALAMTAWDFFLDPQMVAWNLWIWQDSQGGYFGIPWVNFLGWVGTAAAVTLAARPNRALPRMPLLSIYILVWMLQTIGQALFWGQWGPALVGFIVMGFFVFSALYKLNKRSQSA